MENRLFTFGLVVCACLLMTVIRATTVWPESSYASEPTSSPVSVAEMDSSSMVPDATGQGSSSDPGNSVKPTESNQIGATSTVSSEVSSDNTTNNNNSSGSDTTTLCLQCEDCKDANTTCASPTGVCFMSFSTVTNRTSRGCETNKTTCELAYPGGISANDVCQFCCSGSMCNDVALTYSQCKDIMGNHAVAVRMSVCLVIGSVITGLLTRLVLM